MRTLQDMLTPLPYEELPPAWQDLDLTTFSSAKRLWGYQQAALRYALKALWKYYEDLADYREGEGLAVNRERKAALWRWYRHNGLEENLDIPLKRQRRAVRAMLEGYYQDEGERLPYRHFINRMGFWMATGSGKSLVLIKLIELLWRLMRRGEIPPHPVLVLTARDDLLEQLKAHVTEFNRSRTDFRINLVSLRDYPDMQYSLLPIVGDYELTVFFYRADNLGSEQKKRIVDFRNYENRGRWYVLLDEAHKGDRRDSKRQHIYSILSRNGFLFNFSATFTDQRDILTTVYNFNLSEFVRAGYGKHIAIFKQENRAFREREDYTGAEKQRVVLKALLMLAYARRAQEMSIAGAGRFYHRPLMLTLVHTVNPRKMHKRPDLVLFFREIERIGRGRMDGAVWQQARRELWQELERGPEWLFEGERFEADRALFDGITPEELLRLVYNAPSPGEVEVLLCPSNRKEMAFKLKSAEEPFALIKIGNIAAWLREELEGYEVIEEYEDEGFFRRLNEETSPINILMGSRTFYEGWDSNRPNVITYINIGTGTEAKKFILQSAGRGVRIEPLPGQRRRLRSLYNAQVVDEALFESLKGVAGVLETLFIFGTNRNALQTVIQQLDRARRREAGHEVALAVNQEAIAGHRLLIPVYRSAGRTVLEGRRPRKFEVAGAELERLQDYVRYLDDPRLLVARHRAAPEDVGRLRSCLAEPRRYFSAAGRPPRYGRLEILMPRLFAYFKVIPQEVEGLKPLEDEIRHFRHIKVFLRDIGELEAEIKRVREAPQRMAELRARYEARQLPFEELLRQAQAVHDESLFVRDGHVLRIKRVARHYYVPMLLSEGEKADFIRHVIRHPSEIRFLNDLESYLADEGNAFQRWEWWAFSRIDETLDEVHIPYYDPHSNRIRRFLPDFIFWLQRGREYAIVFVDPKGMQQTGYQHKVDGFRALFVEEGRPRVFSVNGLSVRVHLLLYTEDANRAPARYRAQWFDAVGRIAEVGEVAGG